MSGAGVGSLGPVWLRFTKTRHGPQVIYTELITFRAGLGWAGTEQRYCCCREREGTRAHLLRSDIIVVIFNEMKDFIFEMCLDRSKSQNKITTTEFVESFFNSSKQTNRSISLSSVATAKAAITAEVLIGNFMTTINFSTENREIARKRSWWWKLDTQD